MRVVLLCIACFLLGGLIEMFVTALATTADHSEKCAECHYRHKD